MKKINKELKNKLNIILLILVTVIVLYISLKDNFFEVIEGLTKLNIFWIIIALIFVMGYYYFRTLSLHTFVNKFKEISFNKIFKIVFITQFFDGITPSSSGGQPYQIYAFKKEDNLFNKPSDRMPKSAQQYLQECKPIIIIDEPQSVDNTPKSREAIEGLNPLFELRYSATHRQKINTVYRLTPVDAYNMHIVKQICVVNNNLVDDFNKPYIKLLEVNNKNGCFKLIACFRRETNTFF